MYPVGNAIAELFSTEQRRVNVSASSGSSRNVESLLQGEIDLALISGDVAFSAAQTEQGASLRALGAVYTSVSNWMAPVELGAVYVHDLKGLRLGVGPHSSATELTALRAAQCLGLDQEGTQLVNCSLSEGTDKVLAGELDAVHGFSGAPIGGLSGLAQEKVCRVLLYTQEELEAIVSQGGPYILTQVSVGTYAGQLQTLNTFGVKCLLCMDASADPELVYQLTRTLWENRNTLYRVHPALLALKEDSYLAQDLPIPLHEGAQRFYREVGQLPLSAEESQ